jgi:uncharacterized protein
MTKSLDYSDLFDFIETKKVSLEGFTLIEGFPDLGLAGTIGTRYLIEKLNFEQIGHIDSKLFLPIIRVQKGLPIHPVRIYFNKDHKIVIIIAEQIIANNIAGHMAKAIIDWIKKKKISRVISTSGIRVPGGKSVYAFASDEKSKKIIKDSELELVNNGITSGVTALMMLYLKDNKIDAFCLMGNAKSNADYVAASEIVKAFCKLMGICLDVKPLLKEAKKLENAINEHLKTMELQKKQNDNNNAQIKPMGTPMYI